MQFRAVEGHGMIVRFELEADLMQFSAAHLQTCSTAILEKYVATKYIDDVNHLRTGCKRESVCARGACVNGIIFMTVHGDGNLKVR